METTVEITRKDVFQGVAQRMEWEGDNDGNQDLLSVSQRDRSLFHSLFDEAAMHAIDICRPFLMSASNTDTSLTLSLSLSKDAKAEDLPMALQTMLTTHIVALWQEMVNPARAEATAKKKDAATSKVMAILYHHPAPKRKIIENFQTRQFSDKLNS